MEIRLQHRVSEVSSIDSREETIRFWVSPEALLQWYLVYKVHFYGAIDRGNPGVRPFFDTKGFIDSYTLFKYVNNNHHHHQRTVSSNADVGKLEGILLNFRGRRDFSAYIFMFGFAVLAGSSSRFWCRFFVLLLFLLLFLFSFIFCFCLLLFLWHFVCAFCVWACVHARVCVFFMILEICGLTGEWQHACVLACLCVCLVYFLGDLGYNISIFQRSRNDPPTSNTAEYSSVHDVWSTDFTILILAYSDPAHGLNAR